MLRFSLRILLGASIAITALASSAQAQTAFESPAPWQPSVDVIVRPGTDKSRGQVQLFAPIWQDGRSMLFGDVRLGMTSADEQEGNFGLGWRQMQGDWLWGVHGYLDIQDSAADNTLWQGVLGAEAMTEKWDATVNAYIGLTDGKSIGGAGGASVSGPTIVINSQEEAPAHGVDVTLGYTVPMAEKIDARFYGAAGYFDRSDYDDHTQGRLGAEARFYDVGWNQGRFTAGIEIADTNRDDPEGIATFRLRLPFGAFTNTPNQTVTGLSRRMADPVQRDWDVVRVEKGTSEVAVDANGDPIEYFIATDDPTLQAGTTNGPDSAVTFVSGNITTGGATLQTGQQITGNSVVTLRTASGQTYTGPVNGAPTDGALTGTGGSTILTLGQDTIVTGLTFTGGDVHIAGDSALGTTTIRNVTSINAEDAGISLGGITDFSGNINIQDSQIENSGQVGIEAAGPMGNISISNTSVQTTTEFGVSVDVATATLDSVNISSANHAFSFNATAGPSTIVINGGEFSSSTGSGVQTTLFAPAAAGTSLTMNGTRINGASGAGISFTTFQTSSLALNDVIIENVTGAFARGISFIQVGGAAPVSVVDLDGITLRNISATNLAYGVDLQAANTMNMSMNNVMMDNITATTASHGLSVRDNGSGANAITVDVGNMAVTGNAGNPTDFGILVNTTGAGGTVALSGSGTSSNVATNVSVTGTDTVTCNGTPAAGGTCPPGASPLN